MIGIWVKNKILEENLISLYPEKLEKFSLEKSYEGIITDQEISDFFGPILYINCPTKPLNLSTPFSLKDFEKALNKIKIQPIELKFYLWQQRLLINKATQRKINLTQKEAELIHFLFISPNHSATKEALLNGVWHYHEKAQTHTLQTHLFQLKQKLGEKAPPLIEFKKSLYHLL